jgi:hypothetical protein
MIQRIFILVLCLTACGTVYDRVNYATFVGRVGMHAVRTAFDRAQTEAKKKCAGLDESTPAYQACMVPIKKREAAFSKTERNVYDGIDLTEKGVRSAKENDIKDPRSWRDSAKAFVCLLDGLANWLPKKAQDNWIVKMIRGTVISFAGGCKK